VIPRAIRWNWSATTAACKGRSNDTLKERLTRYRQIMTLSGRRSHKNNPRLDLTGVEFRGEAAMKFQAAILLPVCLTLSAWSQLTFTVPVRGQVRFGESSRDLRHGHIHRTNGRKLRHSV